MKIRRKIITAALAAVVSLFALIPAFADSVLGPVPVTSQNLVMDASGYLKWSLGYPSEYGSLEARNYEIQIDIMTTGSWRENYRSFRTPDSDKEITYALVGIYRFRVRTYFVGGQISEWSDYSDPCTVTSDYVTKPEPNDNPTGPTGPGSGIMPVQQAVGPGTSGPGGNQKILVVNSVPAWVEQTGTWQMDASGNWTYVNNGILYANRWGCIYNQYANTAAGQRQYDWFYFDEFGHMKTGWFAEPGGSIYYLNPLSDGTRGRMVTGWARIDSYYYYFNNKEGSGQMGALLRNTTTPDGHRVDEQGRMIR